MAAKTSHHLFRGAGRNALDLPVAGLAALAAAFAAFAIPQDLLSRAVIATGLPSLLSAAQPPLGLTARVALAVGGAVIVFGLVFLLLRLFDRSGMSAETDADLSGAPRVRRRDGHPDAPAPRPISAARDLGEPAPPRKPRAPTPLWLDEAEPVATPADVLELLPEAEYVEPPVAEPEPVPAPAPVPAPGSVYSPAPAAAAWPEPEPEPAFAPQPAPVPVPEVAVAPEPVPVPEPVPEPVPVPVREASVAPEPAPAPEAAPAPRPQAEMPTSVAALMERLEEGLARRRTTEPLPAEPPQVFPEAPAVSGAVEARPQPAPAPAPQQALPPEPVQVFPEAPPAEDRLQRAIASLQHLAAKAS